MPGCHQMQRDAGIDSLIATFCVHGTRGAGAGAVGWCGWVVRLGGAVVDLAPLSGQGGGDSMGLPFEMP